MNVGEMQRLLSVKAEREPNHRFDDLYSLICNEDWLWLAHDYVGQNAGSKTAGCDGIDMGLFDEDAEGNLKRLREVLGSETFEACPVRRVYIPKPNGKMRPLGIPSIRDRIVQEAVRMVLEPIFEADFCQDSFGFRPNRCTMDAMRHLWFAAREHTRYFWAIEGDISAYFDTIGHRKLLKLLRRRIKDAKLLGLIWKFLRAGVMERKLFKDTNIGTPQGGIVSPLLANIYLHELDKYMERYTSLSPYRKATRRKQGLANFTYARYADDFVILCNGTQEQTLEMRKELHDFLQNTLSLRLSLEKTKVTHLNDGIDFLGFRFQRAMSGSGRKAPKLLIPEKAMKRHLDILRAATSPDTHEDSLSLKILALNRIIGGWCRYYQYTTKPGIQFRKVGDVVFWLFAHWIGRKFQLRMTEVMRHHYSENHLGMGETRLLRHADFKMKRYLVSPHKTNPYTTQAAIEREERLDDQPWLGTEDRSGMADLRLIVLERDGYTCKVCHLAVTNATANVDHVRPVKAFKRPVDANFLENLWTLCIPCHKRKTELDRQRESRVQ